MKYADGQEAKLGDKVKLGDDEGIVVCSIDSDDYSEGYSKEQWDYLKKGVMISFQKYGLIHYKEPENDLKLVSRK
jgi:hypothetical protein